MWAGGPPSGLDLTVKGEGEDPGPAPLQSSEGPEAGAHVQKQEAAPCQSPHGSGYPGAFGITSHIAHKLVISPINKLLYSPHMYTPH